MPVLKTQVMQRARASLSSHEHKAGPLCAADILVVHFGLLLHRNGQYAGRPSVFVMIKGQNGRAIWGQPRATVGPYRVVF